MNRSTPLKRRKPLAAAQNARKAPKGNEPSQKVRGLVLVRDGWACVACSKPVGGAFTWWSLQHRLARGQGGTNDPSNLIALCGSATSPGCHLKCEQRDREMHAKGYWLESWQNPRTEPVMYFSPDGSGVLMYLDDDGGIGPDAPMRGVP